MCKAPSIQAPSDRDARGDERRDRQRIISHRWPSRRENALEAEKVEVLADKGYFNGEEIAACEDAGIDVYVPKPATSNARARGAASHREQHKPLVREDTLQHPFDVVVASGVFWCALAAKTASAIRKTVTSADACRLVSAWASLKRVVNTLRAIGRIIQDEQDLHSVPGRTAVRMALDSQGVC
jgi:hypothetical protein